jgi:hypothetical protein
MAQAQSSASCQEALGGAGGHGLVADLADHAGAQRFELDLARVEERVLDLGRTALAREHDTISDKQGTRRQSSSRAAAPTGLQPEATA